jgi:stress response protein YsnF
MASDSALPPVIGAIADDRDGNALGTITTVFLDDVTQRPTWVGLTDGLEGTSGDVPVIAPISDAEYADGRLRLTVPADAVRTAPRVAQPDRLSPEEETTLREHYRAVAATGRHGTTDTVAIPTVSTGTATDTATDTSARRAGTAADSAMTRSEEQLQVSTVVEPWTRAVLRIEEVTEEVMVPVTITRQQARIDYLPLSPTDRPDTSGTAGTAGAPGAERSTSTSEWVTLYAEQPTVTLERVPVERVRLHTSWATEDTTVTQELRREQVELTTTETPLS